MKPLIAVVRTPDGRFHNPWPASEPHGFGDVLKWAVQRRGGRVDSPPHGSFPRATPEIIYPRATRDVFNATWMGHSTVLLQLAGLNIITDPMFSDRASPLTWAGPRRVMDPALSLDKLPPIDVVLLSHNHYDHLDAASVRFIARTNPSAQWIVPLGLEPLVRRLGAADIEALDWWQETLVSLVGRGAQRVGEARHAEEARVDALRVTATPSRHFSARGLGDRNRTLWCGFALQVDETRVYFAGDSAYHPDFDSIGATCGPFDFVMIPIGAYDPRWFMHVVHVDPEEAVQVYRDLVAPHPHHDLPVMLGIHWGTFRLTDEAMDEPPRRTLDRWRAVGLDEEKLWIARFGETRQLPYGTRGSSS